MSDFWERFKQRLKGINIPNIYMGIMIVLMYVPILLVIIYSFNESKISSVWAGFSLKWYEELFRDRSMLEATINSLILATQLPAGHRPSCRRDAETNLSLRCHRIFSTHLL